VLVKMHVTSRQSNLSIVDAQPLLQSHKIIFVRKFLFKDAKFQVEKPSLCQKFRGKIKILRNHNLFHWKFGTVCWNAVGNLLCQCLLENRNFFSQAYFFSVQCRCWL